MALGGRIHTVPDPMSTLKEHLATVLPESKISALLHAFRINSSLSQNEQISRMYVMIAEYGFRLPAWDFVDHFSQNKSRVKPQRLYYAQMEMVSPFQGKNQGKAHHAIDVVFGLQNFKDQFAELQQHENTASETDEAEDREKKNKYISLSNSLAYSWLVYAYGEHPWTPYKHSGQSRSRVCKIFDYGKNEREVHVDELRYVGEGGDVNQLERWRIMRDEIGCEDEVWGVFQGFLNEPQTVPEPAKSGKAPSV